MSEPRRGPCNCCGEHEMTDAEAAARAHALRVVATMIDKKPRDMEWGDLAQKLRRMAAAMVPEQEGRA